MGKEVGTDRYYIGSGNISGLIGESPFSSPVLEYLKIIGEAPKPTVDDLTFFARRKRLEPFVFETLALEHGLVFPTRNVRYVHPEHDFIRAEIDGENPDANAEVKTVDVRAKDAQVWRTMSDDSVPLYVLAQTQFGLMVRPKPMAYATGQVGFDGCFPYPVKPDLELQEMLLARAVEFWNKHVLPRVPPEPVSEEDVKALYPRSNARKAVAGDELVRKLMILAAIKSHGKTVEAIETDLVTGAKMLLQDADELVDEKGVLLATWRVNKDSRTTDWKGLAEHLHGVLLKKADVDHHMQTLDQYIADYTTGKPGARPFLLKLKLPILPPFTPEQLAIAARTVPAITTDSTTEISHP